MHFQQLFSTSARLAAAFSLALSLTACESIATLSYPGVLLTAPGLLVASSASLAITKKLPPDHLASYITKKDCSALHLEQQEEYCKDPNEPVTLTESGVGPYCYRTIGMVTCYDRPLISGRQVR
jgi:hypothetical protein